MNAKAEYLPIPLFPQSARSLKPQTISVRVSVNENGWVSDAKACSRDPLLHDAVERAARRGKFKVTTLSGKPVPYSGLVVYRFDPATSLDAPYELPCFPTMNIIKIVNEYAIDLVLPTLTVDRPAITGAVSVQVLIGEDGRVEKATAVSGPVFPREAAVEAAYKSRFRRFVTCGTPTKLSSILVFNIKEKSR